jgi:dipeptidyl aminopeptidase/acylaminoacyl peptidase
VSRAAGIRTPVLLLHGEDDDLVPVQQARDMEHALGVNGADVEAKYYPRADHGLAQNPAVRADLVDQITQFLCTRYDCVTAAEPSP